MQRVWLCSCATPVMGSQELGLSGGGQQVDVETDMLVCLVSEPGNWGLGNC